jgi:hypothetical protein
VPLVGGDASSVLGNTSATASTAVAALLRLAVAELLGGNLSVGFVTITEVTTVAASPADLALLNASLAGFASGGGNGGSNASFFFFTGVRVVSADAPANSPGLSSSSSSTTSSSTIPLNVSTFFSGGFVPVSYVTLRVVITDPAAWASAANSTGGASFANASSLAVAQYVAGALDAGLASGQSTSLQALFAAWENATAVPAATSQSAADAGTPTSVDPGVPVAIVVESNGTLSFAQPSATASPTPSTTASPTPSETPTPTPSPTPSETPTPSITPSETPTPSSTPTPSGTPTPTTTLSFGATQSPTPSQTGTPSITPSKSGTPSVTPSKSGTPSITPSISDTPSTTGSRTPSRTPSVTPTATPSRTASISPGSTASPTPTQTRTVSPTASSTPSPFRPGSVAVGDPFGGDGTVASSALIRPSFLSFDVDGSLFFSDIQSGTVRKIAVDGTLTTVAGSGVRAYVGDGGDARKASLHFPAQVAVDKGSGAVFVTEPFANTVRKLDIGPFGDGRITPAAGYPILTAETTTTTRLEVAQARNSFGNNGPALSAFSFRPVAVAWDVYDNLFFVEEDTSLVRMVEASTGLVRAVAGSVGAGYGGDGGLAIEAFLSGPRCVTVNPSGTKLYVCDSANHIVRVIDLETGVISRVAGIPKSPGSQGLGGPATSAYLTGPEYLAARDDGAVFISEGPTGRVLRVDGVTGIITSLLSTTSCNSSSISPIADAVWGSTSGTQFFALSLAANGLDLLVFDYGRRAMRLVNFTTGLVTPAAGVLDQSLTSMSSAESIGVDQWGNHYGMSSCQLVMRRNTSTIGTIVVIAGSTSSPRQCGSSGDGQSGTFATFTDKNVRIAVSRGGNIAITDPTDGPSGVSRIRIWRPTSPTVGIVSVRTPPSNSLLDLPPIFRLPHPASSDPSPSPPRAGLRRHRHQ